MKEQIAELAKQASDYVNEVYTPPVRSKTPGKIWEDGHVGWHTQFNEKFAQLIVEECRNVLADVYRQVPPECCGHFLYADDVLAKHFYGVKEQTESQKMAAAGYTRRPRGWTKEGTE